MNELCLLTAILGAEFPEAEVGEGHKKGVEHPEKDDIESVEGIGIEWLSERFRDTCAECYSQVEVIW